jgi:hypothetical protein
MGDMTLPSHNHAKSTKTYKLLKVVKDKYCNPQCTWQLHSQEQQHYTMSSNLKLLLLFQFYELQFQLKNKYFNKV